MKTLIPAIVAKLKATAAVAAQFSDRIYQAWNPNDVNLLTTVNKFPFAAVIPGVVERDHEGSQLLAEDLRVTVMIYHELYKQEDALAQKLLDFQELIRAALEYETTLTGYTGAQLIEAFCVQLGAIEPFTNPDHPMSGRTSITMEYQRVTEEVLI